MFTLSWQPPYDWPWMLGFLAARAVEGVETVEELSYVRSLSVGEHRGLVRVVPDLDANVLHVTLSTGLQPVASECLAKITRLFDLGCCRSKLSPRWVASVRRVRGCACRDVSMRLSKGYGRF